MFAPHLQHDLPGTLALGPVRLPVFSLVATVGLLSALVLSDRTAERAGVARDRLWDAGVFAVCAAFLVSRLLLVLSHWDLFRTMPGLVLTVPSITEGGLLLTAAATSIWLWAKRVPLLQAIDAWAPCGALLAVFLDGAHFLEGTDAGMPSSLPWAVVTQGDTVLGRTHPVQLYGALAALCLLAGLLSLLHRSHSAGAVAAAGMGAGGAGSFLLGFFRQPAAQAGALPVDPAQALALLAAAAGGVLWVVISPQQNKIGDRRKQNA